VDGARLPTPMADTEREDVMSSSQPASGPRPVGPYTPIVRVGDWLVCSGQVGLRDGQLVEGVAAQTAQCIANVRALLNGAGADLASVVKTTVFMTDIGDYATVNEAYIAGFGDHRPARSAVAVAGLPLGALVEVEVWAYVGAAPA
jgi:2-iminobutanoate/2-iminopropanoate deaminase